MLFQPCSCLPIGSKSGQCDKNGKCPCKDNYDGEQCKECKVGFTRFPLCDQCSVGYYGVKCEGNLINLLLL